MTNVPTLWGVKVIVLMYWIKSISSNVLVTGHWMIKINSLEHICSHQVDMLRAHLAPEMTLFCRNQDDTRAHSLGWFWSKYRHWKTISTWDYCKNFFIYLITWSEIQLFNMDNIANWKSIEYIISLFHFFFKLQFLIIW